MGYTAIVAPWTRNLIDPRLQASAIAAAAHCTGGGSQTSCNLQWATGNERSGSFGVGEQMAALEVIQSLLYPSVAGPATYNNGGISLSNPDAGLDIPSKFPGLDNTTLGDKISASVLTIIILTGTVVGAGWLLSEREESDFREG
jgi:mannan endo-1,6-alpha-mannosidase